MNTTRWAISIRRSSWRSCCRLSIRTTRSRGINGQGEYDPHRDWFLQNVRLMEALTKKGYDVNYSWGMGVHSHNMGGAMLPEMMRWLWRDQPVSLDPRDTVERSFRSKK